MNNRAFSKIWIIVIFVVFLVGGILAWQYWMPKEEVRISEEVTKTETTQWEEYILEKITEDLQSADFTDRRLIGVKDGGQRDIIIPSVKELMGWEKTPGETGFYPVEVSFPPYSSKIFFVKYQAGTGHSSGFFMLDVNTLESKRLIEAGSIYENYYNYISRISPDGLRIASLGGENLYLLDLINDRVELLAETGPGEVFYPAKEVPDFAWLDNYTIQYPVYSTDRIYDPPVEIRQISIKEIEEVVEDETVDWKTYRNEEYGYELEYPNNVSIEEIGLIGGPATEKSRDIVFIVQNPEYLKTGLASNLKIEIPSLTKQESDLLLSQFVSQVAKDFAKEETLRIGGEEAIKLTFLKGGIEISSYSFLAEDVDIIFIKHNQAIFMLTSSTIERDKATSETIFNQMLSTFRFL